MKIYILKLQNDCWYIGKTNSEHRIQEHFQGKGCKWTILHPPINIHQIIEDCDEFDEDKYVKKYMAKYGIDNVRGGAYSYEVLNQKTVLYIQKEINHAKDICFLCNKQGHLSSNCYMRHKRTPQQEICRNCGQYGHTYLNCYNKPDKRCYKCNKNNHDPQYCRSKKDFR